MELDPGGPSEAENRNKLRDAGLSIVVNSVLMENEADRRKITIEVREIRRIGHTETPGVVSELMTLSGVLKLQCKELG